MKFTVSTRCILGVLFVMSTVMSSMVISHTVLETGDRSTLDKAGASLVGLRKAPILIDEEDARPRPFNAAATLPPLSPSVVIAASAAPSAEPSTAPEVPLFDTAIWIRTSLLSTIACADVPVSSSGATNCGFRASPLKIKNTGTIPFDVYFIKPNGILNLKRQNVRAGASQIISYSVCLGDRYIVQDSCGKCMYAIYVSSTLVPTVEVRNEANEATCPTGEDPEPTQAGPSEAPPIGIFEGVWEPLVNWQNGVIAVALVNIPGSNKVMGIAAVRDQAYTSLSGSTTRYTQAALYDPETNTFEERDLDGHDIFCAGFSLLPDGTLVAVGGGQLENSYKVSTYDPFAGVWSRHADTVLGHWYGTAIVTAQDDVMIALGTDKLDTRWRTENDFPEKSNGFNFDEPWSNMSTLDLSGKGPDRLHWYPAMHLMSNGDILESGTQNAMYRISTDGSGSIAYAGDRNKDRAEKESWGSFTIMYDANKLLTVGGIENWKQDGQPDTSVYQRAITIDMTDPLDVKTQSTGDLAYPRAFPNLVTLPSGQVLAIGGKDNLFQWDDTMSVYNAELWDPKTGIWTLLAAQEKPRNYHSSAILLKDGRVLSGGGGLCGYCKGVNLNHADSQIFNPPYLYDGEGNPRGRPVIRRTISTLRAGAKFSVIVTGTNFGSITRVSLVKQSSVTHSISSDARQLKLPIVRKTVKSVAAVYRVQGLSNPNVMTPGYWFLFVLDHTGTPSVAAEIRVVRD